MIKPADVRQQRRYAGTNETSRMDMSKTALAVKVTEAGNMLSVSRATVYNLINAGQLRTVKVMGATRVTVASIRALVSGASAPGAKRATNGKIYYPGIVEKGADGFYISFPDLPGCVGAGDDMQALAADAEAAIKLHVSGMLEDGEALPTPSDSLAIAADSDVTEVARLLVGVDAGHVKVRLNGG